MKPGIVDGIEIEENEDRDRESESDIFIGV